MSLESTFDKLPQSVRTIRFADACVSWKVRGDRKDLYFRNVNENGHWHLFVNGDKVGMVLTNEHKRGMAGEHTKDILEPFMRFMAHLCTEMLSKIELIAPNDPRYKNKKVVLFTMPEFEFLDIKRKMAYYDYSLELHECRFSDIDAGHFQIGSVRGWFGREVAMVIVGKGQIAILRISKVKKIAGKLASELHQIMAI